jgi:Tol biopolymer transport system component
LKGAIAGFPRWSPDARRIAFHSRQQGYARLFLVDLLSGVATPLNYQPVNEALPSWSHDGKWLYCNSRRGGDFQVWRIRVDGGQMTQLTFHGGWSPLESCDGRYVFYTKVSQSGVWRIPVAGGTEEQVFTDPVAAQASAYAVGQQGIYFVTGPDRYGQYSLALFSFITGKRTVLEHLARPPDLGLAVSPDERTIIYSQVDHASSDLMLIENFQD